MTYNDMLGTFTNLYRTRLFDDSWTVTQEWTGVNVAWLTGYLQRKFVVEVKEAGTIIFVLQQVCYNPFVPPYPATLTHPARHALLQRSRGPIQLHPTLHPPKARQRARRLHLPRAPQITKLPPCRPLRQLRGRA